MLKNFSLLGAITIVFLVFTSLKPMNSTLLNPRENLQDRNRCNNYVDVKTDSITGVVKLMAKQKMKLLDKDGKMVFDMMMIRHNKEVTLHFKAVKPVCISQNTKIIFEFTDDSITKNKSSNRGNCKGVLSVNMGGIFGDGNLIKRLSSSTLRNIKFESKSEAYQIDLNIDQKETIINTLDCFIYS